ncbi:MAG: MOSC domain-containing protein [Chloroflexi bacterium]|nr:MOSC domain-containing protein [Chloroflexota bacterium]
MSQRPRIFQINASKEGGVPKLALREAEVGVQGIVGSRVANPEEHGGPERALCLYSLERILALQAEGHPLFPGSLGENVTTVGLDWDKMAPGVRLRIGKDILVEVTRYTSPCTTISASFLEGHYERISHKLNPGWSRVYARVLQPGHIYIGDPLTLVD